MKPLVVINFKKAENVLELAKACEKAAKQAKIIIAVLPKDVFIASKVKIPVYLQYINSKTRTKGAKGTLLNHSDNPISNSKIKSYLKLARKAKLITVTCCTTTKRAKEIAKFKPDFIAVEPKELIGGKISVSTAKPSLISNTVNAVKIPILCGAGIHSKEDVKKALKLGAKGVLVSSAVAKAKNPEKALKELVKGIK